MLAIQQKAGDDGLAMENFKEQHGAPHIWCTNGLTLHDMYLGERELEKEKRKEPPTAGLVEELEKEVQLKEHSFQVWEEAEGWKLLHRAVPHNIIFNLFLFA